MPRPDAPSAPEEDSPAISVVLPAFNEEKNLLTIAHRIVAALEPLHLSFEVLWVNDGSSDATEEILDGLAAEDPRHRPLHLSRNFGHMAALTAGLEQARAHGAVISLDADGQHPPELLPELIQLWQEGADIVQTIRSATDDASGFKRFSSALFYKLMALLSDLELPSGAADFRLLDRQVVDVLNQLPERSRFLRGLVHWVGFTTATLDYEAPARLAGTSKYSFRSMLRFALNGVTSFSVKPLRLILVMGFVVLMLAGLYAAYALVAYALGWVMQGWTSLLLVILALSGVQLITLGVASEYLGRIYDEVKHRPIYIIKRTQAQKRAHLPRPQRKD